MEEEDHGGGAEEAQLCVAITIAYLIDFHIRLLDKLIIKHTCFQGHFKNDRHASKTLLCKKFGNERLLLRKE